MPKHSITAIVHYLPTKTVTAKILNLTGGTKGLAGRNNDLRRVHLVHCCCAQNAFALKRAIAELKDHPGREVGGAGLDCAGRRRRLARRSFSWGYELNAINESMARRNIPPCRRQCEM